MTLNGAEAVRVPGLASAGTVLVAVTGRPGGAGVPCPGGREPAQRPGPRKAGIRTAVRLRTVRRVSSRQRALAGLERTPVDRGLTSTPTGRAGAAFATRARQCHEPPPARREALPEDRAVAKPGSTRRSRPGAHVGRGRGDDEE